MQYFIIAYVYCTLRVYSIRRQTDWQGRRSEGVSWYTEHMMHYTHVILNAWALVSCLPGKACRSATWERQINLHKSYLYKNIEIKLIKIKATMI